MAGYDVIIELLPDCDFIDLKGDDQVQDICAAALAIDLPNAANSVVTRDGDLAVWCISPGHWLLQLSRAAAPAMLAVLEDTAADISHSFVEVSDMYARLQVSGIEAREVLAQGINIDLHKRAFPPGSTARTGLAQTTVQLTCTDKLPRYELLVFSSYTQHVFDLLTVAAATNESAWL